MKNIFICIWVCFTSILYGQIDPINAQGPGLTPEGKCDYYCSKMHGQLKFSQKNHLSNGTESSACPSSFQAWATYDDAALISELKRYTDYECFRPLFQFEQLNGTKLFSTQNFNLACYEIFELLPEYNGESDNGLYGLLNYLHAFVYHEFYQSSIVLTMEEFFLLKEIVTQYLAHPNAFSETTIGLQNLAKLYILCDLDETRSLPQVISAFNKSMKMLTVDKTWTNYTINQIYAAYLIGYDIVYATARGIINNDLAFQKAIKDDEMFIPLFANLVKVEEFDETYYFSDFPKLAMTELLRMCMVPSLKEKVSDALASIAASRPANSSYWYRSVAAINMKGECEKYNLCYDVGELKKEVLNTLFPHRYEYEDGKIKINTPLVEDEAQKLYYASLQVQAQFFRMLDSDAPLAGDPSDTLNIYIYGTRSQYEEWQYELFGLNTNNGGIYIERGSTFYSYERTPAESIYSLEELFRHEYTHYLVGRYIDPLFWGETNFYTNEQLTWFNEGIAEYFAGSSRTEKVKTRTSIAEDIKNDATMMNPNAIVAAKYNQGTTFYRYSCAFINYLIDKNPTLFYKIINSIKSYSVNQFNAAINEIKTDNTINEKFAMYLQEYTATPADWWKPETNTVDIDALQFKSIAQLNDFLNSKGWTELLVEQSASYSLERFKLVIDESNALCEIDQCLKDLGNEDPENNFYHAVGYHSMVDGKQQYVITGPFATLVNNTEVDSKETALLLFPNPVDEQLEVFCNSEIDNVMLISNDGRMLNPVIKTKSINKLTLDVRHILNGMYHTVVIDSEGRFHYGSFIKQE